MALNSDQISIIENSYIMTLYDQMEQEVLADITRRVSKMSRFTETAEIQARNMREQGYNTQQIMAEVRSRLNQDPQYQKELSENTKQYKQEVMQLIQQTEADALAAGDMLTAMAGDMSFNDDMQMWAAHDVDLKKDNALKQITDAAKDQLAGDLRNITGTGKKSNLYLGGVGLENAYTNQLDLALIKMVSGNMSYTQAVKDCVQRAAAMGITVQYKKTRPDGTTSTRNYQLDTAVRMCVRTASTQLAGKISERNMDKTKQDLVYVDAHAGARPTHAVWQGQVYAYTTAGQTNYSKKYKDFWTETDYGSPTGLKGINCSHNFYPYWEGDPIPEFKEPDPVDIDGKTYTYYEATQEQRKQERNVRAMKRELTTAKAAGDDQKVAELQKRISEAYKKYNKFSGSANLRPKYERMGVWDNSTPARLTPAGAKYESLKNQVVALTDDQQLRLVNRYNGRENCQGCMIALELRYRGKDVYALEDTSEIAERWEDAFEGMKDKWLPGGGENAIEVISKQMSKWGHGARAEVYIKYEKEAHVFMARQIGGVTQFEDPQAPDIPANLIWEGVNPRFTQFVRIDTLNTTDTALEFVGEYK